MENILLRKSCTVNMTCLNSLINYCNVEKLTQILADATCQYTVDKTWDFINAQKCKSSLYTMSINVKWGIYYK